MLPLSLRSKVEFIDAMHGTPTFPPNAPEPITGDINGLRAHSNERFECLLELFDVLLVAFVIRPRANALRRYQLSPLQRGEVKRNR